MAAAIWMPVLSCLGDAHAWWCHRALFPVLPQRQCKNLHSFFPAFLGFFKHFSLVENSELPVLASSFRGKSGIKNFKVELSPVTSSLEETLSKSYHISPAREKICHENPSELMDSCRGGDFCQQWLLSGGKQTSSWRCESSEGGKLLPTWQPGKCQQKLELFQAGRKGMEKTFRGLKSQCGMEG